MRPTTKFSKSPASVRSAPPNLGEHSCEVLREAGYADEQIETLLQQRVVLQHPAEREALVDVQQRNCSASRQID